MTESTTAHYVAIIQIHLPGQDTAVSANIRLTPTELVSVGGSYKTLHECTLAELQQFADQIEAEVWQTYREIRLAELAKDSDVKMAMDVVDAEGEPVAPSREWLAQMVVETAVPAIVEAEEAEEAAPAETEPAESDDAAEENVAETAVPTETEPEPEDESSSPPVEPADDVDNIIVSEPEPVHEEVEAQPDPAESSAVIAPSRARVRLAGRYLPVGDPTPAAVDITIEEPALRAAQAHALSSLNREVAGVLIGPRPEKQPDGRYRVHILDTIIAKYTVMHGASVTYTPESWRYMTDKLHERYPDETAVIVGWYHTHPGFGIFLSGMDLFIHQNFFTQIWHVAYVLDPRAQTSGFFSWNRKKTEVARHSFHWPDWAASSW
ncbi:Mov34/MPN/PAD-1 family protein [Candidatus Leptofilum sp.]|uniref:Mov34/MPN/PAD-1 family protein n=1 Tax=Candidatus Leptofilum sp. TaxID=3241576 RepID=UPI003B5C851D